MKLFKKNKVGLELEDVGREKTAVAVAMLDKRATACGEAGHIGTAGLEPILTTKDGRPLKRTMFLSADGTEHLPGLWSDERRAYAPIRWSDAHHDYVEAAA